MIPTIPQLAGDAAARTQRVTANRQTWRFDTSFLDFAWPAEIPRGWDFSARWYAKYTENAITNNLNTAAIAARHDLADLQQTFAELRSKLKARLLRGEPLEFSRQKRSHGFMKLPEKPPHGLGWYDEMFHHMPAPACAATWREDWRFGWNRIAGVNPIVLQRVTKKIPDKLPVDSALYSRAVGGVDSLDAAIAQGRLYLCDYWMCDGFKQPNKSDYPAPIGLFAWLRPDPLKTGRFMPVAIQCQQRPGPDNPVWTPQDGMAWQMARAILNGTDKGHHAVYNHSVRAHVVAYALICSLERNLAPEHPLRVLLEPNFESTVAVTWHTMDAFKETGGVYGYDLLDVEGITALGRGAIDSFNWKDHAPNRMFELAGTADSEALPMYPYRDDARLVWKATRAFAADYLRLYYASDFDVSGDDEVAAWVVELGARDGGRIAGVGPVETREQLADLVAEIIFHCSTYHAAINHWLYDTCASMPNFPMASWAGPPQPGRDYTEKDLLSILAPMQTAVDLLNFCYQDQFQVVNQLGVYERKHFTDPRVGDVLERFHHELSVVEDTINRRNEARPEVYGALLPSKIPASIQI